MAEEPLQDPVRELFSALACRTMGDPRQTRRLRRAAGDVIAFSSGIPFPESYPAKEMAAAVESVLSRAGAQLLPYGGGPPAARLPGFLTDRMVQRGLPRDGRDLVVTAGSGQALDLISKAFVDPGDVVVVEGPTYMDAPRFFRHYGARMVSVPLDEEGIDVEAVAGLVRAGEPIKLLYTVANFQNPSGVTMSLDRRERLLALAARAGFLIVEDDAYGDLRFAGRDIPPLAALDTGAAVLYVGTLSKLLAPAVRVGWIYGPARLIEGITAVKNEGATNPFVQGCVAEYLEQVDFEARLDWLRSAYSERLNRMLQHLQAAMPPEFSWSRPQGGYFVWCRLPEGVSAKAVDLDALDQGVACLTSDWFYPDGDVDDALRLSFSYVGQEAMQTGIERLGKVIRSHIDAKKAG